MTATIERPERTDDLGDLAADMGLALCVYGATALCVILFLAILGSWST